MIRFEGDFTNFLWHGREPELVQVWARLRDALDSGHVLSLVVPVEARNIFSRLTKQAIPEEWEELVGDFNAKLFVDPMNWHLPRREADKLFGGDCQVE